MTHPTAELQPGLSVVIPVYNAADTLDPLVERLERALVEIGRPFEVILVNDGSADDSWERIVRYAASRPWLRGVNLMRNYGQHNALLCGIRLACHDVTVTLDDDLQNPPEEIAKLLVELDRGHDVVYGNSPRQSHPWPHRFASWLLKLALSLALGARTARITAPLRVFRTRLRQAFARTETPWVIVDIYLTWATTKITAVEVRHDTRLAGTTTYSFGRRFAQAFDLATGFSTLPLKFASWVGFVFTVFGIGVLVYVVVIWMIYGGSGNGFAFLASTIAIFSGAQLFALGILGEYLARMFQRVMGRPPYAVGETIGVRESDAVDVEAPRYAPPK